MKNSVEPALYKSVVAYDGTDFNGFQRQAEGVRTVQAVLEQALRQLGWAGRSLRAAGRTDRGVHAQGQVVAFQLGWKHSPAALTAAMNAQLPQDIAVRATEPAPDGFDPRRSATGRRYVYRLLLDAVPNPLRERFAWRIWPPPDQVLLRSASDRLLGRHDFGSFGSSPRPGGHTVRELRRAEWQTAEDELHLILEADAFLYHMVRRIVGALIRVARGKAELADLDRSLANPSQAWKGGMAPAHGLCLEAVLYGD